MFFAIRPFLTEASGQRLLCRLSEHHGCLGLMTARGNRVDTVCVSPDVHLFVSPTQRKFYILLFASASLGADTCSTQECVWLRCWVPPQRKLPAKWISWWPSPCDSAYHVAPWLRSVWGLAPGLPLSKDFSNRLASQSKAVDLEQLVKEFFLVVVSLISRVGAHDKSKTLGSFSNPSPMYQGSLTWWKWTGKKRMQRSPKKSLPKIWRSSSFLGEHLTLPFVVPWAWGGGWLFGLEYSLH